MDKDWSKLQLPVLNTKLLTIVFRLGYYVWPAFLIWGLDRFFRVVRIIAFKLRSTNESDAKLNVLSPHFLRVTLRRPHYFRWVPGQCVYLTFPGVSTSPLEAHPFTISTIDVPSAATDEATPGDVKTDEQSRHEPLVFLVRVRKGFTKQLSDAASQNRPLRVLVDGPYGSPPLLRGFATVVMIAGMSFMLFR